MNGGRGNFKGNRKRIKRGWVEAHKLGLYPIFMAITKLNGHDVLICVGTTAGTLEEVAAQRDCSLSINNQLIEKASGTDGTVREYLAGLYGWTMQVSGLYELGAHASLVGHLLAGTLLYVGFMLGDEQLTGTAYIESMEVGGPLRGKTTYNVTLRGSGALTVVEDEQSED